MKELLHLVILTPYGRYFEGDVSFVQVCSEKYSLGILPNHAPLISTIDICKMIIKMNGKEIIHAIGGGIINVDSEKTTLILNSVERSDEIDKERAEQAKKRAEERLKQKATDDAIDVNRAKLALLRAINRLKVVDGD